ncbi:trehalose-phosphatase [Kitasatospora fiedleri]|uniref:trehalose-phosphatase n=1 Tax=Kitasatospora fiedleri TaxID=2991545 RepID=UPI00249CAB91|nr:trehalose-phosphatase [Kitasatospora fiedleri]
MSGFFFDFDGTLSRIQVDPATVLPVPGAVGALTGLAGLVRTVGIVSARPVDFLRSRFEQVPGVVLHGLYGLERWQSGVTTVVPGAEDWGLVVAELLARAREELPGGILVEDKRLSMALHCRRAPRFGEYAVRWGREQARLHGLVLELGPMTVELKPPVDRDKGTVLAEETSGLECAWYFGDGAPDLAAFRALTDWSTGSPDRTAVRVAVDHPDADAVLLQEADLVLDGPDAVPGLLDAVGATMGHRPGG